MRIWTGVATAAMGLVLGLGLATGQTWAAEDGHAPHWGYKGASGPAHWAELDPAFAACGAGHMQSPIDLGQETLAAPVEITLDYSPVALEVVNNGHTLMVPAEGGGTLTANGVTYRLLQFHFHTPSEHVIDGKPAVMEGHLVHRADDGSLAVLGVLFKKGPRNRALYTLSRVAPRDAGETRTGRPGALIDPNAILPEDRGLYRYMGSLTTPPCSEGVHWFVLDTPVEVGRKALRTMARAMGKNARPAQALNNRLLVAPAE